MVELDDRELRLLRFVVDHKEVGSKAAVFSLSEAAEFLGATEEEIYDLIKRLSSKGMIKPLLVSKSPKVHLEKLESLNISYLSDALSHDNYLKAWYEIERDAGLEIASFLPPPITEVERALETLKNLAKSEELIEAGVSGMRPNVAMKIRSRAYLYYRFLSNYLSFCVWRLKHFLVDESRESERSNVLKVAASYLYPFFSGIIEVRKEMAEDVKKLEEEMRVQDEVVRTLREISQTDRLLTEILNKEEAKLREIKRKLSLLKKKQQIVVEVKTDPHDTIDVLYKKTIDRLGNLIKEGVLSEEFNRQLKRSLYILLSIARGSIRGGGKMKKVAILVEDGDSTSQIEHIIVPYDTSLDLMRELVWEGYLEESPTIREYILTTREGKGIPREARIYEMGLEFKLVIRR